MSTINYLTQEEYDKLLEELDYLKTVERDKASKAIAEAREKGDLSENAEYDAAKEAQGKLELRINQLSKALNNSRVISADDLDGSSVTILCKVTIKNKKNNAEMTYQLVSESTADLKQKKISVTSPIGKALLGKAVGDTAEVQTPGGILEFEILNISL